MKFPTTQPLLPLDGSRYPALPPANTRLAANEQRGVISHPRKNAGPDRPKAPATQRERLEEQSRKWIAQTFYGTMLKQMRQSPFRSDLFDGGRGGQAYNELYDQKMVEHMSRGAGGKLVNAMVRKIEHRRADAQKAYEQQGVLAGKSGAAIPGPQGTGGDASSRHSTADPRPGNSKPSRNYVAAARGS